MRIAVVNNSEPIYNLGSEKILEKFRQEGQEAIYMPSYNLLHSSDLYDAGYFSAIFTRDLPKLCQGVNLFKTHFPDAHIEIGGPAPTAMPDYIERSTSIKPHLGIDERFEHVRGNFLMEFTSRGCRNRCPWCLVPRLEPDAMEYDDFNIPTGDNPYIGDNNILATSLKHQELVVEKLKDVRNLDINSGFEVSLFTEDTYQLYSKLHLEAWRIAFDSMKVERDFVRAVNILKKHHVDYRKILVYVLIGFPGTTLKDAVYRLERARELHCSPYPQRFQPLNSTDAHEYIAPGWDKRKLELLRQYWVTPGKWRRSTWRAFVKNDGQEPKSVVPQANLLGPTQLALDFKWDKKRRR